MGTGFAGEHGLVEKDLSRDEAHNYSMEVRSDPFESAKSHFFDTSSWGEFCDVTLTLKQALQPDHGGWVKIDDYRCRQAFRHFMNLLNSAVHCAIELPSHFDAITLENMIREWLGEGRMGSRQNSCPRRCERGLDRLHVERPSEVRVRRFS